ncbi:MAG: response regulator [Pseudomonadota bacterium]
MRPTKTLLVVDDLEHVRDFYRDVAEDKGWAVVEAFDAASFEAALDGPHDALILDLAMPSMTGIEGLELMASRKETAPIVIASGQDESFLNMSMKLGRDLGLNMTFRLSKPIQLVKFERTLDMLETSLSRAVGSADAA